MGTAASEPGPEEEEQPGGLPPWLRWAQPALQIFTHHEEKRDPPPLPDVPPLLQTDAIPWWRPLFWSPTTECEAQEALSKALGLIGCPASSTRVRIPYADEEEPTYVQQVTVRAADAGWVPSHPGQRPLTVVILPGYDAGSMFYFRQLRPLAELGCDVYGVDLLGHGLSSRPPFRGTTRQAGEAFYTDALEAWATAAGVGAYVLFGHSFGGYIASCWALAHPARLLRLVLAGSAGMEERNRACIGGEHGTPWGLEGLALDGFNVLWHVVQPQAVVRLAGPLGPAIAADYIQRKFGPHSDGGHLSEGEAETLERYCFHCLAGGGRGAVAHPPPHHGLFFGPGALCFSPLGSRLDELPRPVAFIYGLYDWMDWRDGARVRLALSLPASLALVENAGHHVYLENPEGFRDALAYSLADHLPGGPASAAPLYAHEPFEGDAGGTLAEAEEEARRGERREAPSPRRAPAEAPGGPLPPPVLFLGVCRYPSGFEDAAVDEALELCLAGAEADVLAEGGGLERAVGVIPLSDRHKAYGLHG